MLNLKQPSKSDKISKIAIKEAEGNTMKNLIVIGLAFLLTFTYTLAAPFS